MTEAQTYTSCELTLNGITAPIKSISWEQKREEDAEVSRMPSASFSGELTVTYDAFPAFFDRLFPRPTAGASEATLVRRVRYGGRKGRSALRRLIERAPLVEMSTSSGGRALGKVIMLNEREVIFYAKEKRS